MIDLDQVHFDDQGLVPVVAQDHVTGAVLMLAYADRAALQRSIDTREMTYWSRSRQEQWVKGATSGHTQRVVALRLDCDRDAVLALVEQAGPACHTGTTTCWSAPGDDAVAGFLGTLERLAKGRQEHPKGGYTDRLLNDAAFAASKVEEEAGEVGAVLRGLDNEDTLEHEAADLLYHLVVALRGGDSSMDAVLRELARRHAPTD